MVSNKHFFSCLLFSLSFFLSFFSPEFSAARGRQCGAVYPATPSNLPGHPIQVNNFGWTGFIRLTKDATLNKFTATVYNEDRTVLGEYAATNIINGCSPVGSLYPVYVNFDIVGLSSSVTRVWLKRTGVNTWQNTVRWNNVLYVRDYTN